MAPDSPSFRFWLRRSSSSGNLYALRFEVFDGRGVLRVARPGVLVDPPARESGYEADLTLTQVRSSRFLHVSDLERRRQIYFLSRIPEELPDQFAGESWVELAAVVDRGAHHLLLGGADGAAPREPRPAVRRAGGGRAVQEFPSLPPSALVPLSDDEGWTGERGRPSARKAPPSSVTFDESGPPTSLIRYLRRQLSDARRENAALLARIAWLEARLTPPELEPLGAEIETTDEL